MITAREALKNIRLTDAELVELGRIESAVISALGPSSEFTGVPIRIEIYTSEKVAPEGALFISPELLPSADRLICIFKYRRQQELWNVEISPDRDAYGTLKGYVLTLDPSMLAFLPEAPKEKRGGVSYAAPQVSTRFVPQQPFAPWFGEEFALPVRPLLSIIFGTYNRIEHLQRAVFSVRRSARRVDYEIVVCDGGSTDGSREWLSAQPDVVLVAERHLEGAVKAFNQCWAMCRGEFVANLNDDCVVQGEALAAGVRYLQEHAEAGQVAFGFRSDGEDWHINEIYEPKTYPTVTWPTTYANFGITRRSVAKKVATICGGFWNPAYKTYAADCELSAWIWKLGHRVDRLPHLRIMDTRADDQLRATNNKNSGLEAKRMYARWPADAFRPTGPDPKVSAGEIERFHAIRDGKTTEIAPEETDDLVRIVEMVGWPHPEEERRLRKIAPAIRALDPVEGQFPKRAEKLRGERVLHVSLCTDADPQAGLVRALKKLGSDGYREIRWYADYGGDSVKRQAAIIDAASELKATFVFMQLQTKNAVDVETVQQIRAVADPHCVIATWCGDIGSENSPWEVDWQVPMGRVVDLTMHSSMSHVRALRAAGVSTSAYLQIGYDDQHYRLPNTAEVAAMPKDKPFDVCFLGSYYSGTDAFSKSMKRHDGELRDQVVRVMKTTFGDRFGLFGKGWGENPQKIIPLEKAHEAYWLSKIGLNVSLANFLDCYTSDRMHRILGSGALLLTKRFPMMSTYGLKHNENCFIWDTPEQAVTLAQDYTQGFGGMEVAKVIAAAGAALARDHHTWNVRMLELQPYIDAVRGAR